MLYGTEPAARDWKLQVDHRAGDAVALGFGLAKEVKDAVLSAGKAAGIATASIQPALSWGMDHGLPKAGRARAGWRLWGEQDRTLVAQVQRGRVVALNPAAAPVRGAEACRVLVKREALRFGSDQAGAPVWVGGWHAATAEADANAFGVRFFGLQRASAASGPPRTKASSVSRPTIDFLHPTRPPALGWAVLGAGAASLAAALWLANAWAQADATRAQAQRAQAEARLQQAAQSARRTPAADERRQQFLARQLGQAWLPTLRLVENATQPPVFVLALSMDPAAASLRLDGEAPDLQGALDYASVLHEKHLLGPAELRSHETTTDMTGRPVVRFTLLASWGGKP